MSANKATESASVSLSSYVSKSSASRTSYDGDSASTRSQSFVDSETSALSSNGNGSTTRSSYESSAPSASSTNTRSSYISNQSSSRRQSSSYATSASSSSAGSPSDQTASTARSSHASMTTLMEHKALEMYGRYGRLNDHAPFGHRRVYLVRSAHRLDQVDPNWIELSGLNQDTYTPISLDFPIKMPQRHDNRKDYACDPPLSEFGQLTGQIVGRELRLQGADIHRVFSSSALSCVQTAVAIIKGYRTNVKICIEPGLAEHPFSTSLMTPSELHALGYPVDAHYKPQFTDNTGEVEPALKQYQRIGGVVSNLLKHLEHHGGLEGGTLVVANALGLDAISRSLLNRSLTTVSTSAKSLIELDTHYPACTALALEQLDGESAHSIVTRAVRPITHLDTTNAVDLVFAERV